MRNNAIIKLMAIASLLSAFNAFSQINDRFPTANILTRVHPININRPGTAFFIKHNEVEYLVTAKHLLKNNDGEFDIKTGEQVTFEIEFENRKLKLNGRVYFHSNDSLDIALIKITSEFHNPSNLKYYEFSDASLILGQEFYFYGFPYNLSSKTSQFKIPFIKRGFISAISHEGDLRVFYGDGHNNPGFSGGPAVCFDYKKKKFQIFGVISAYKSQVNKQSIELDEREYVLNYKENTGIIVIHSSHQILEMMKINGL